MIALPLLFIIYYAYVRKISLSREIIIFTILFILLSIAHTLKFMEVHPRFVGYHVLGILVSYFALKAMGQDFFVHFEKLVYYLCIFALLFYLLINLLGWPFINLLRSVSVLEPGADNVDTTLGFFTIPVIKDQILLYRNAGFAWEPGAFACLTALGIFVNLVLRKFKFINNHRLYIMVLALLSSQSTTGYVLLLVLMIFAVYNKDINIKHKLPVYLIVIALAAFASTLPFMYEKIKSTLEFDLDRLVRRAILYDSSYALQRFSSFALDFIDFKNHPIIGYGGHNDAQWIREYGAELVSISGVGKVLARFGIIGAIFFTYSLIRSSREFAANFNFKGWWFLATITTIILVSYPILEQPLIICFWLYFMLRPKSIAYLASYQNEEPLFRSSLSSSS